MMGGGGVGKSCLTLRLIRGQFVERFVKLFHYRTIIPLKLNMGERFTHGYTHNLSCAHHKYLQRKRRAQCLQSYCCCSCSTIKLRLIARRLIDSAAYKSHFLKPIKIFYLISPPDNSSCRLLEPKRAGPKVALLSGVYCILK